MLAVHYADLKEELSEEDAIREASDSDIQRPVWILTNEQYGIREVWKQNLKYEFRDICYMIQKYPYVAMDTEFPGFIAKPFMEYTFDTKEYNYHSLKSNVNMLHIIQLGLSLFDKDGNKPEGMISTWQFNFNFDLTSDQHAVSSIRLLKDAGIDFPRLKRDGIEPLDFAELLTSSGCVLLPEVQWLSFNSRYDFGYLLKLLRGQNLPSNAKEFFNYFNTFFPKVYDLKILLVHCENLKGGLEQIATQLNLQRVGRPHQAGSDSLMTGQVFFRLRDSYFMGKIHDDCDNILYGLSNEYLEDDETYMED